jgi:hypothetical protein
LWPFDVDPVRIYTLALSQSIFSHSTRHFCHWHIIWLFQTSTRESGQVKGYI